MGEVVNYKPCPHDKIIRSTVWWICGRCDKTIEPVTNQMSIYDYQGEEYD
jgi:hypothetical protein